MRDIDTEIAKKVFGWQRMKIQTPSRIPGESFEIEIWVPPDWKGVDIPADVPNYSSDYNTAYRLMRHLIAKRWNFLIGHSLNAGDDLIDWICEANNGYAGRSALVKSKALSVSICKAILEVLAK